MVLDILASWITGESTDCASVVLGGFPGNNTHRF